MIIVDANVLLYAYNADAPEYASAAQWLEQLFKGPEVVGLSWLSLWAFVRVSTNPRLWRNPKSSSEAFETVRELLAHPRVIVIHPGARHCELLERAVTEQRAIGPLVSDAALAALAMENGAVLASTDRDFSRFPGLRWVNPLA